MPNTLQCSTISSTSQATSSVIPPGLAPLICHGMSFSSHSELALCCALSYPTVHTENVGIGLCPSALDLSVFVANEIVQYWTGLGHSPPSATVSKTCCQALNDMLCSMSAPAVLHPSVPPALSSGLPLISLSNPFSSICPGFQPTILAAPFRTPV